MPRYLGDFQVGTSFQLGSTTVTEEAIIRFGREFDPQLFHIDPEAAKSSSFGGLVASGLHTASIFMRLFVDGLMYDTANLGGLGMDDMHWRVPVRPGDTLTARTEVLGARPSRRKPDRGVLELRMELENQHGELVWDAVAWSLMLVAPRPEGGPSPPDGPEAV